MNSFDTMSLQNVGQVITDTIDFETSANINRVVVKDGVDTRLDEMRHLYAGMDSMLGEVARQISATAFLPDGTPAPLNVVYFPQIGYLISVPSVSRNMAGTGSSNSVDAGPDFVGEDWEFQFCTATMWYYKNPQMREMDEYFGDTYGMIGGAYSHEDQDSRSSDWL